MSVPKPRKKRASRNRTIGLTQTEKAKYRKKLLKLRQKPTLGKIKNRIVCGDALNLLKSLPKEKFDLFFSDPPYNLNKNFGKSSFKSKTIEEYEEWLDEWISKSIPLLKPTASVYICGDWRSASAIQRVGMKYLKLQNRITWEREKGRGSKTNWKNASEDIWFFTVGDKYTFNADAVRLKRKVIAPYKEGGKPKDWSEEKDGNFRLTSPSNLWTDLTVPFWSMPENTDHPTQKPEKLLAKIILASTDEKDLILDPFAGSGTTAVVAKKLKRNFVGIESDEDYCMIAEKRLELAKTDKSIQGFQDGVFWERNTLVKK